jgi:hypothetical protein
MCDVFVSLLLQRLALDATVAARRDILLRHGGFRTERRLAEDWELLLRLAARYPFAATGEVQFERTVETSELMSDPDHMALGMKRALALASGGRAPSQARRAL